MLANEKIINLGTSNKSRLNYLISTNQGVVSSRENNSVHFQLIFINDVSKSKFGLFLYGKI